jgi:hypothetical protein
MRRGLLTAELIPLYPTLLSELTLLFWHCLRAGFQAMHFNERIFEMALSDTCYDTISDLCDGFKFYCHWYGNVAYCSGIIDAMFSLAEVAVRIDAIDPIVSRDIELTTSKIVVISLLDDDPSLAVTQREAVYVSLIKLAGVNPRLAKALKDVEAWINSEEDPNAVLSEYPMFAIVPSILEMAHWSSSGLAA